MKHIMRVKNDGVMRDDVQIDFITFTDVLISSENVWSILSPPELWVNRRSDSVL